MSNRYCPPVRLFLCSFHSATVMMRSRSAFPYFHTSWFDVIKERHAARNLIWRILDMHAPFTLIPPGEISSRAHRQLWSMALKLCVQAWLKPEVVGGASACHGVGVMLRGSKSRRSICDLKQLVGPTMAKALNLNYLLSATIMRSLQKCAGLTLLALNIVHSTTEGWNCQVPWRHSGSQAVHL